jgi:hypothetical protein
MKAIESLDEFLCVHSLAAVPLAASRSARARAQLVTHARSGGACAAIRLRFHSL